MSLEFRSAITTPHQGYEWRDGDYYTGKQTNLNVFKGLVRDRKLAVGQFCGDGWWPAFIDQLCRDYGHDCVDKTRAEPRQRTWEDYLQFGSTMLRFAENGGQFVSQEEADRRAAICLGCPLNRPLGECSGCKAEQIGRWLAKILSGRSTALDHSLLTCAVCGCDTKLAAHFPLKVQRDDRFKADDFASQCWKRAAYS